MQRFPLRSLLLLPALLMLLACGQVAEAPLDHSSADLVLTNGNILTVDARLGRVEAIAVLDDRIAAVGSAADISAYISEDTQLIDLQGQTAIPGFIEGHGHYTSFGGSLMILDFRYAKSFAEIVSMVEAAAESTPAGEWIIGRGWHQDKWQSKEAVLVEGLPVHDSLSAATPDHPVMLIHTSGHGVFCQSEGHESG